ncbi:MAG TPA: hypothetical protein V6C76_11585 [Drouetiella sp.]
MTDLERLKEVFTSFGLADLGLRDEIQYEKEHAFCQTVEEDGRSELHLAEGKGYSYFCASFRFDANGKFVEHSIAE